MNAQKKNSCKKCSTGLATARFGNEKCNCSSRTGYEKAWTDQ